MIRAALFFLVFMVSSSVMALTFPLPKKGDHIVGKVQTGQVQKGDTFAKIGRRYDVGVWELVEANPGIDSNNPAQGTILTIPSEYILPDVPWKGIVINLAEMRLYYFPKGKSEVVTFPVGVGNVGWQTPEGEMHIVEKIPFPTWIVPQSILDANKKLGINTPPRIPPGPDDPLGKYALRLSKLTYLIHGTDDLTSIGLRSTAGCVRMFPEDIKWLFDHAKLGMSVRVINQPYKLGWQGDQLFLEAHEPLQEQQPTLEGHFAPAKQLIQDAMKHHEGTVDWTLAKAVKKEEMGLPQSISK